MAGGAAQPAETTGPQDFRTRRHVVLGARPARRKGLHQPHDHPGAVRQGQHPTTDIRGNITSHRARSTIASQLYNAKEPMTLLSCTAWLGHRRQQHPALRQDHAAHAVEGILQERFSPQCPRRRGPRGPRRRHLRRGRRWTTLAALRPRPRLVHLQLFEQCPHRMACARCNLYTQRLRPKPSCSKPATTCSACSPASRSPTTNAPPSTTDAPPSPHCSIDSPTSPPRQDPPHGDSERLDRDHAADRADPNREILVNLTILIPQNVCGP